MEQSKINRINELAHLAKERTLTEEELSERDRLRKEYIADFRRAAMETLDNTYVISADGKTKTSVKEFNAAHRKTNRK